jgi:ribosomal protein S18 acetylase RimI-like enzyme
MRDIAVRRAAGADLDTLVRLMAQVQALHAAAQPDVFRAELDAEAARAMFAGALASDADRVFVANRTGAPAGYLWLALVERPADPAMPARRFAYVNHIGVAAEARGQGIGRALVEAARGDAMAAGVREIGVDYWDFNAAAAAFFARVGFVPRRHIAFAPL